MQANGRANVLVAEDSLAVTKRLGAILEQAGYHVETARNGVDALRRARRWSFDLVITDERMPVMSGRELCRQLRSDKNYVNTPIFFLTAENVDGDWQGESDLRISGVFPKPFNPSSLVRAIEAELSPR